MTFLGRASWSTVHAQFSPLGPVSHSVIHHTATGQGGDLIGLLRNIEASEMGRGDGLIAIAYHRLYAPDGTSIEGRPIWAQGGATYHHNGDSRAYCFIGNFQAGDVPTDRALAACAWDIAADIRAGWLTGGDHPTWGHRDVFATACPGDALYAKLPSLRKMIEFWLKPQKVEPMFNPSITIIGQVVDYYQGRMLTDEGYVYCWDAPAGKGPHGEVGPGGQPYFKGRKAARFARDGAPRLYTVLAVSGERYDY